MLKVMEVCIPLEVVLGETLLNLLEDDFVLGSMASSQAAWQEDECGWVEFASEFMNSPSRWEGNYGIIDPGGSSPMGSALGQSNLVFD